MHLFVVAVTSLALAGAPLAKSPELVEKGKSSFAINCASCHGATGAGDGAAAVALNPKPRNFLKEPLKQGEKPEDLFKTLQTGVTGSAMIPFTHLTEEDRWGLVYYVLELRSAAAPAPAAAPGKAAVKGGKQAAPKK
jgi:mono/diheme cytochrome c family protein